MRNTDSFAIFQSKLLIFIRSSANSVFNSHKPKGIKLITRFLKHKFKHSFQDSLSPFSIFGSGETLLHLFVNEKITLLNYLKLINRNILEQNDSVVTRCFLYSNNSSVSK